MQGFLAHPEVRTQPLSHFCNININHINNLTM